MNSITDIGKPKREELKTINNELYISYYRHNREKPKQMKSSTDLGEPKREEQKAANDTPYHTKSRDNRNKQK